MKRLLFILASITLPLLSAGQSVIYSQNFNAISLPTEWPLPGSPAATDWTINLNYTSSSGFVNNTPNQPGAVTGSPNSKYLHTYWSSLELNSSYDASDATPSAGAGGRKIQMNTDISTVGYTGVAFNFYYLAGIYPGFAASCYGFVQFSTNGGVGWTTLGSNLSTNSWTAFSQTNASMDNQATLRFRFCWVNPDMSGIDGSWPPASFPIGMAVDEITLTGFPPTSITTGTITPSAYCAGSAVSVPFTSTGTFNAGNIYTAKLSSSTGSFATPTSIGTLSSTASSGTISATIPGGAAAGTAYRIRVDGSDPITTGTDNGSNLTINAIPTVSTSGDVTICAGDATSISATGATNYTWMPGTLIGPGHNVTPGSTTTYSVTGSTSGCNAPVQTLQVTVEVVSITASASPPSICVGDFSTLTGAGGSGTATYEWASLSGPIPGQTLVVNPINTSTYTVTGTDGLCSDTGIVTLTVSSVTVGASATSATVCSGSLDTLNATGPLGTSYSWMPGSLNGQQVYITPLTNTTYTVTGTLLGCTDTEVVSVNTDTLPVVTLAPISPDTMCHNATPVGLVGGDPAGGTYSGTMVAGGIFTPSDLALGDNWIYYEFTDSHGCVGTDSTSVFVKDCSIGINENTDGYYPSAYPNPSGGKVMITFKKLPPGQHSFEVVNILGEIMITRPIKQESEMISLPRGLYFLRTSFNPRNASKIVIE